jgi:hypothetical protein
VALVNEWILGMIKTLSNIHKSIRIGFKSLLVVMLVIASVPVFASSNASAEECDTVYYSANDILWYNPCETCSTSGQKLLGTSNEEKIFRWLTGKGFNAAQAAGIMGNIQVESSFNPFRMQTTYSNQGIEAVLPIDSHSEYNKAFGLVQWDGSRRQQVLRQIEDKYPEFISDINNYGKSADGYKNADTKNDEYLAFELEFMYQELENGYKRVFDEIKAQPDTEEGMAAAAGIWNQKYEVSSDSNANRAANAKVFYDQFKDAAAPQAAGGQCSSGEPAGEVVWYSQTDTRWANIGFAGGTIGPLGCGPTSMAMILASLVDKNITPPDVAAVAGNQQGGTSSHANLIAGVNEKWNLNISATDIGFDAAVEFVKSGKGYVWVGGQGAPPFTNGGHMVAMVGVASDGQITIADPAGDATGHQRIGNYPPSQIAATGGAYYGVPKK